VETLEEESEFLDLPHKDEGEGPEPVRGFGFLPSRLSELPGRTPIVNGGETGGRGEVSRFSEPSTGRREEE